ncbi:acetyl-CoA C-acetyltransferase [bacterium]|nr:acetyl-CoA C-acetyltransferase [Bacteroidota bacterium]MDC3064165.1 acetyl-CoA C-acetyltransferase [bacterium]
MEAYIYDAVRTVRGKGNNKGALLGITPTELVKQTMVHLKDKHNIDTTLVEDIILGCVTQVMDQAANIAKSAAQAAEYGDHMCGVTLNRFCGSGLESINQASAYIKSGYKDLIIAGGVECMSRVKMGSDGGGMFIDPNLAIPGNIIPQGISADLIASKYGYTREDLDKYAVKSQKRAALADENNFFKSRISVKDNNGIQILTTDENIRPDTDLNGLSNLMPAFEMIGGMGGFNDVALDKYPEVEKINHVHHAGNSSAIVDGAAITLIGNKDAGKKLNLSPRFKILTAAVQGVDPTIMLTGPAPATMKALKNLGMELSDIDLFEVNEAFSAIPMLFMEKTGVDSSIVNVNGGSIAMGHPLGATGCILTGTIMDEIERRDLNTGLVTLCIGGGMGIATIIERV